MTEQHAHPPPPPRSYPSPSMQPTYSYQGQSPSEQHRASPTSTSIASLPSLNLPPIRAMDAHQSHSPQPPPPPAQQHQPSPQQAQQQLPPPPPQPQQHEPPSHPPQQPQMGSPLSSAVASMGGYYQGQPLSMPSMRYPIPPQPGDSRLISGGRHKKEIKRRTKTGCLTCRKRRIKCDEAHPTCRNCQKSKRECMGYDPIFKPQPGPAQIQPAPSAPSSASTTPSAPANPGSYSHIPPSYAPAVSAGYVPAVAHSIPASTSDSQYDYPSTIDPALAISESSAMSGSAASYNNHEALGQDLRTALESSSSYSSATPETRAPRASKTIPIEDVFCISGIHPPPPQPSSAPITGEDLEELEMVFRRDYASGMDRLLETNWFTTKGFALFLTSPGLIDTFGQLIQQFRTYRQENYAVVRQLVSLECKTVWQLLCLCRNNPPTTTNGANGAAQATEEQNPIIDTELQEVRARLDVLECLLTYRLSESNPTIHINYTEQFAPNSDKALQIEFWGHLGTAVSTREDGTETTKDIFASLASMRNILGQLENRDVLYSMAVCRFYGNTIADFPQSFPSSVSFGGDDSDPRSKIAVGKNFLEMETGQGMSQVVMRIANMAIRSWTASSVR